ncbi:uncharacterized protein RecQ4 isoform X2 [Panulirus ornatus]|uniref:uncharacterized protein RecQ4 isoform X2 n=1 Tax=Panulirus ornatus TaxID=150431 RepID=UPI003A8999AF
MLCIRELTAWEDEYKAATRCSPDKATLASAPEDIKAAYRTYHFYRKVLERKCNASWEHTRGKRESSFESKSRNIALIDDSENQIISSLTATEKESSELLSCSERVPVNDNDHSVDNLVMNNDSKGSTTDSLQNPRISSKVIQDTFVSPPFISKDSVWGKHLNKNSDMTEIKVNNKHKSLYTDMAEKLRLGGTIKVRTSLKKSTALNKQQSESYCTPENTSRHSFSYETNRKNYNSLSIEPKPSTCNDYSFTSLEPLTVKENLTKNHVTEPDTLTLENEKASKSENLQIEYISVDAQVNESSKHSYRVKRRKDIKKHHSQAVSAISLITNKKPQSGVLAIKKKAVLNHGWVVRCTGADLSEETGGKDMIVPSDSWKMRLGDKDWIENEEGVISKSPPLEASDFSMNAGDRRPQTKDCFTSGVPCYSYGEKCRAEKSFNEITLHREKLAVNEGSHKEEEYLNIFCKEISFKERPSHAKNKVVTERTLDDKDHVSYFADTLKSVSQRMVNDPYDMYGEVSRQESNNEKTLEEPRKSGLRNWKTFETEPVDETDFSKRKGENLERKIPTGKEMKVKIVRKRKKVESVEELLESGKIQSAWPPPKKQRIERKKKSGAAAGRKQKGRTSDKATDESRDTCKGLKCKGEDRVGYLGHNEETYDEVQDIESHGMKNTNKGSCMSAKEHLIKKVISGAASDNYVRINLKKKTYVRGRKNRTASKYKRQEWKKKQIMKNAENGNERAVKTLTCFKCGDFGHWAKNCSGKVGDNLMPLEDYNEKESTFLSLEEAALLAKGIKPSNILPVFKMSSKVEESREGRSKEGNSTCSENSFIDLNHETNQQPLDCNKLSQNKDVKHEQEYYIDAESEDVHLKCADSCELSEDGKESSHLDLDDDVFANIVEEDVGDEVLSPPIELTVTQCLGTSAQSHSSSVIVSKFNKQTVEPLYRLEKGKVGSTPVEVYDALHMFGYSAFRPGQEIAIMRILSGLSTLLVLSTGSGKSLCYQLPAYLYAKYMHCITVCVSPLVSLMEDQVTGLPNFLHAVCLHTHQNPNQRLLAMNAIRSGRAHILLVSPEALVASRTGGVLGTLLKDLPPVAFACLDEAHCVSEWSHNFRPSYLRVCQVLRERLGVQTILGLTATARQATALGIAQHLLVQDFDTGIIRGTSIPENLYLSISCDQNREWALISLLQGARFSKCSSIIIYCTRREECERIATLIRTQLLDPSKVDVKDNLKRTRGISFEAEAYHAGLSSHRRQQVQKRFMTGKLRIVVATVAFGMGIDKADVHGIIHFNMPRNAESYVQEIGRAGRDGEDAQCHLFLDVHVGRDIQELKRHIYANSLDRHTVRKLLNRIFKPCACAKVRNLENFKVNENKVKNGAPVSPKVLSCKPANITSQISGTTGNTENSETTRTELELSSCAVESFPIHLSSSSCPRHEIAIPIDEIVKVLDLPEENLETLLCYLELHHGNLINLNSHVYANCTVSCYGGPKQLVAVSRRCPPLAVAIALERQKGVSFEKRSTVSFPVVEVASCMGWNSKIVKRELKALEWSNQDFSSGGRMKRSGVIVEFTDLSFHMEARGDLSDDELDQLLDALFKRTQAQEQNKLRQLYYIYHLAHSVSHNSSLMCCDSVDLDRCTKLREELGKYFSEGKNLSEIYLEENIYIKPEVEASIRSNVRAFLSIHTDHQWTGRAVARVFHGIGSPNFPAETWCRVKRFWRQHLNTEFCVLVNLATQEIIKCK